MPVLEQLRLIGLIPVAVFDDAEGAVSAAKALLDGGIGAMEITLRTKEGINCIREVSNAFPEMIIGAGTVLSSDQAHKSVEAGAQFIVSPGFAPEIVQWCFSNGVDVIPGCVTPSEIMAAQRMGLHTVKFFPANIYGGAAALAALAAPFADMRFVPTGGIGPKDISVYADKAYVSAIGGGWLCAKADVSEKKFGKISSLAREAVSKMLGFEIAHVGINADSEAIARGITAKLSQALDFPVTTGNTSMFVGTAVEVNKSPGLGAMGHIGLLTNNVERALYYIKKRGYSINGSNVSNGHKAAVYLEGEFGGFAMHLLQK